MHVLEIIPGIELAAFVVLTGAFVVLARYYRRFLRQSEEARAIIRDVQTEAQRLLDASNQESGKE